MLINSISFSNIFCFGNKKQTINFNDFGNGSLNLIIGQNGCGKSSFIRLFKLALYFEADGITGDSISNDINGNGYLSISVSSNNHSWIIESEYGKSKLNSISVYKDGKTTPEDWGKIPDTKKEIQRQIIDIPYHIFSNILSLSINDFKSFLTMNPKDTRNIRDRIFGFFILNEMNEILKGNIKKFTDSSSENKIKIEQINNQIIEIENKIILESERQKDKTEERKKEIENKIIEINNVIITLLSDIEIQENKLKQYSLYQEKSENEELKKTIKGLRENVLNISKSITDLKEKKKSVDENIFKLRADKDIYNKKEQLKSYKNAAEKSKEIKRKIAIELEKSKICSKNLLELSEKLSNLEFIKNWNNNVNSYWNDYHSIPDKLNELKSLDETSKSKNEVYENNLISIKNFENLINEKKSENLKLQEENSLYIQGKCPTCGNDFTTSEFNQKIEENKIIIENNVIIIENNVSLYETLIKNNNEIVKNISVINMKKSNLTSEIVSLQSGILSHKFGDSSNLTEESSIFNQYSTTVFNLYFSVSDKIKSLISSLSFYDYEKNSIISDDLTKLFEEILTFIIDEENEECTDIEIQRYRSLIEEKRDEERMIKNSLVSLDSYNKSYEEIILSHNEDDVKKIENLEYNIKEISDNLIEYLNNEIIKDENEQSNISTLLLSSNGQLERIEERITNLELSVKKDDYFKNLEILEILKPEVLERAINDAKFMIQQNHKNEIESKGEINDLKIEISAIDQINKSAIDQLKEINIQHQEKLTDLEKEERKIIVNIQFLRIIEHSLSDAGIKSYIIKKLVPSINKNISEILSLLEIPLVIRFNEEFKPTIYRYGKEVSVSTISTGQRKMIDSAIIFTITRLLISKCNGINIVFYDEIFSSLHTTAITTMMEIISNELTKKLNLHVFLVNHSFISSSFFDNVMEFYTMNHFSNIDIMTCEEYNEKNIK